MTSSVPSLCCRPSHGARIEILREACVSQAGQPLSTLAEAGRRSAAGPVKLPPALYTNGRDLNPNPTPNTAELEPNDCFANAPT